MKPKTTSAIDCLVVSYCMVVLVAQRLAHKRPMQSKVAVRLSAVACNKSLEPQRHCVCLPQTCIGLRFDI